MGLACVSWVCSSQTRSSFTHVTHSKCCSYSHFPCQPVRKCEDTGHLQYKAVLQGCVQPEESPAHHPENKESSNTVTVQSGKGQSLLGWARTCGRCSLHKEWCRVFWDPEICRAGKNRAFLGLRQSLGGTICCIVIEVELQTSPGLWECQCRAWCHHLLMGRMSLQLVTLSPKRRVGRKTSHHLRCQWETAGHTPLLPI